MEYCANHPGKKALSHCHGCGKPYCESCLDEGKEYYYCRRPDCQRLKRKEAGSPPLPTPIECPSCSETVHLSERERESRTFHCPFCEAYVDYNAKPPKVLKSEKYTEVYETRNFGDIALLKSVLDDSDIDYYVDGELEAYPEVDPVKFFVIDSDLDRAQKLLKEFDQNISSASEGSRS